MGKCFPHIPQPIQLAFQVYKLVLYLLYRKALRLLTLARFFKVLNTVLYATFNTCTVSLTPELFIDISTVFSFTSGLRAS